MRNGIKAVGFAALFAVLSTAVASVILYTLPVIEYAGYQTQIPFIIIGLLSGALIFSVTGTAIARYGKRPELYGTVFSVIISTVLFVIYKLSGPVSNLDLAMGAIASESFGIMFAAIFQAPFMHATRRYVPAFSVVLYTLINVVLFLATAELYLDFGQAFLPYIIASLEVAAALISASVILGLKFVSNRKAVN